MKLKFVYENFFLKYRIKIDSKVNAQFKTNKKRQYEIFDELLLRSALMNMS